MLSIRLWSSILLCLVLVLWVEQVASAASSAGPRPLVSPGNLHLTYSMKCVDKALPLDAIEATIAELERRGHPRLEELIKGYRSRTVDRVSWTATAELWVAGSDRARWKVGSSVQIFDGKLVADFYDGELGGSRRYADLQVSSLDKRDTPNFAGVTLEMLPFLGFPLTAQQYEGETRRTVKTEQGWTTYTTVLHGYRTDGDGKPQQLSAELTYDKQGRLVRFDRGVDTYEYSDFVSLNTRFYYPRTVIHKNRSIFLVGHPETVDQVTTYKVTAADTKKMPTNFFTLERPPTGVRVTDYRFTSPEAPQSVTYIYDGNMPLDRASAIALSQYKPRVSSESRIMPEPQIVVGEPLDFAVIDMRGKQIRLSDFRGKMVIVSIWATWCGPCVGEIPDLMALQERLADQDIPLEIIGVSLDRDRYTLQKFLRRREISYPTVSVYGLSPDLKKFRSVHQIPTKYIIDRDGIVVDRFVGPNIAGLEERIQERLQLRK